LDVKWIRFSTLIKEGIYYMVHRVESRTMSVVDDLIGILGGTIAGLPTLLVMAVPLVVGLVIGYLIKKVLKAGIILGLVTLLAVYFGFASLDAIETNLRVLVDKYGPVFMSYVAIFFGLVPLSLGLGIGVVLGFVFG
jgi:hypothetical protein